MKWSLWERANYLCNEVGIARPQNNKTGDP